jgi:hypothetical protein
MTHFTVDQLIAAPPDAVQAAFCDDTFYPALGALPGIAPPEVIEHAVDGEQIRLRVRYRFNGPLAPPARAVLDPAKLSWIDSSTIDVPARHTRWMIQPEHYGRNLRCGGQYSFLAAPGGHTTQHIEADLRVSWPLVGRLVERALLSGLRQHLAAEAGVVERFVASR